MPGSYWIETMVCPKNEVDSEKIAGTMVRDGFVAATSPETADVVVVNTCAFIEPARAESVETILAMGMLRQPGARLVVTGCLAARAGSELAAELPEVEVVADVGVPVQLALTRARRDGTRWLPGGEARRPSLDLLDLPRPPASAPWAYVKVAEGCDRRCGFCAIPSFRGPQRSRPIGSVLEEVDALGVREVVLVAQDLASYGRDLGRDGVGIVRLVESVAQRVDRVRLLYLYPSSLGDELVDAIVATGVPYFDLSLQHVSAPLLRRMRRAGGVARFSERIEHVRERAPDAALRSSFILGYPGETEEDHDELLGFLERADLDWAGFFQFSDEAGTYAASLPGAVPEALVLERLRECTELQDAVTARRRAALVGREIEVLVDAVGRARSHREAPEIDGIVRVPEDLPEGALATVQVVASEGPDLIAGPARSLLAAAPAARGAAGRPREARA
ncbi:MAG: 30S ribosomal protein S12 methylthiotransferase RimO [Actinomycetota bacterium]|nr:30S ribosomal protein S12 methylthiotransferase RimO [Actinomycetota bacterium]